MDVIKHEFGLVFFDSSVVDLLKTVFKVDSLSFSSKMSFYRLSYKSACVFFAVYCRRQVNFRCSIYFCLMLIWFVLFISNVLMTFLPFDMLKD